MRSFIKEFQEFAVKGNVIDLAVGVVIGAAFGKIVSSLVADIVTPLIGLIVGGVNFSDLKLVLKPETVNAAGEAVQEVTLNYGNFLQTTFDFLVIALAIFMVIKGINRLKKKQETKAAETKTVLNRQEKLLTEIRDILSKQK